MPAGALPAGSDRQVILLVQVQLVSVEVPVGTVSGSEELWSYLDEQRVTGASAAVLGRNGLRIGVGKKDSWTDVAGILTRLTGRKFQDAVGHVLPGSPYPITLRQGLGEQTMFISHEDRTLTGCDYPPGDNLLTLTFTLNQDNPSTMMVVGVPQVRSTRQQPRIVQGNTGFRWEVQPTGFSLEPLTFRAVMPSRDFLVIGPGGESRRASSPGRHFLIRQREGVDFETVLVVIPQVAAQPVKD